MKGKSFLWMLFVVLWLCLLPQQMFAANKVYQFDFGAGGTEKGYIGVSAKDRYDSGKGYGFNTTENMTNVNAAGKGALSDAVQFKSTNTQNTFNVDLERGLYEVTVYLGNTMRTSVWAEGCLQVINMTGNNAVHTFQIPVTDGQLNIMATAGKAGYAYTMSALHIKKLSDDVTMAPTIWICGDSTVCNYYPLATSNQAGWGQMLDQFVNTQKWQIRNLAASGQYAKGFVEAGQFQPVLKYGKKGDIYLIAIGINDTNYSNATEYYQTVKSMAQQAQKKGMKVILVKQQGRSTDCSRKPLLTGRWFGGELDKIGSELNVQVIDLFNLSQNYFVSIGQQATTALYMPNDTLHPNRQGAKVLAELVAKQIDFNTNTNKTDDSKPGNNGVTVYIAGDSTVQSYSARYAPQQGWGYYLKDYLNSQMTVSNHAIAGRSSKSFYDDGRLKTILDSIHKGDYLLVQFGINDAAYNKAERYAPVCGKVADAQTGSFEYYMKFYVEGALAKGAQPVLISPTLSLKSYSNGRFVNDHTNYAQALKQIATYYQIPYIDLNSELVNLYNSIGYDAAKKYYLYGVVSGSTDQTHFSEAGAKQVAQVVANSFKKIIAKEAPVTYPVQIEQGAVYMLKNANSGLYMEVADGKAVNGANVQQWGANGAANHNTWKFADAGNGYYKIYSNVGNGSYQLDVDYNRQTNGTNIQIYQNTNSDAQLFKLQNNGDGTYTIYTKTSNGKSCVEVKDALKSSGANVQQWESNQNACQKWILEKVKLPVQGSQMQENTPYMIKNVNSGQYLEVQNGRAANGANVQQWGANGAASHNTWRFQSAGNGYYKIYSGVGNGSYLLDVNAGAKQNGTNIQIYQNTNSNAQLFKFYNNGDGSYTIYTKASDEAGCVEVVNAMTSSGANVQQWEANQHPCQKWILEKVTTQEPQQPENTNNKPQQPEETKPEQPKPEQPATNQGIKVSVKTSYNGNQLTQKYTIQSDNQSLSLSKLKIVYTAQGLPNTKQHFNCTHGALSLQIAPWYVDLTNQMKVEMTDSGYEMTFTGSEQLPAHAGEAVIEGYLAKEDWSSYQPLSKEEVAIYYDGVRVQ